MNKEAETISEVIEFTEKRFAEIAPSGLVYAAEKGFAVQALKNNDYLMKVAQEQPQGLQQAITNVASIGLSLSPAEHLTYLIPRKGKICLDISYMGFCRLATNSGSVEWIQSELVYDKDTFTNNGIGEKPSHIFDGFASIQDRGDFKGGYCVAKLTTGDYLTTIMSAEEITNIQGRSEAWKRNQSGPWATDFREMAKKSVVRRAFKMWPRTDQHALERMAVAVQLSNEAENFEPIVSSPNITQFTLDQKGYLDQLIESNNAPGMAAFRNSVEEGVWTSLYHSFPKGEKGKYQKIIDNLVAKGMDLLKTTADQIEQTASNGDDAGVKEIIEELPEDEMTFVAGLLGAEAIAFLREINGEGVTS